MKKIFYCLVAAFVLAACVKEDVSITKIEEVKNPYAVTPDEAVQLLKTVIGGESTRAVSVGEIKTLRKSDFVPTTRGAEDGDVIYIVDLENGGSAIMGADKRMEPIYAILDETKISAEQLSLSTTRCSDDGEDDIEEYVVGLLNDKITYDMGGMIPIVRDSLLPEMPMIPRPHEVTVTTQLGSKYPMLRTKWHHLSPFNDLYPNNLGAGCGPVALAQICYYSRSAGSYTFDWDLMSDCEYLGGFSEAASAEVAELCLMLAGSMCKNFRQQTGVTASADYELTIRTFASMLRTPCAYLYYDFSEIKTILDDNRPVYSIGYHIYESDPDTPYGHAWVIDGYNSYKEDKYMREYNGLDPTQYTDTFIETITYNLVHCNYGWGGLCDGYYTSGVFDVSQELDDDMIVDSIGDCSGTNSDYIFDRTLKFIRY